MCVSVFEIKPPSRGRMWSTIKSPTNSTKKLIVVKQNLKIAEPQLITVNSSGSSSSNNCHNNNNVNNIIGSGAKGGIKARLYTTTTSSTINCDESVPVTTTTYTTAATTNRISSSRRPTPTTNKKAHQEHIHADSNKNNRKRLQIHITKIAATPQLSMESAPPTTSLCSSATA